MAQKEENANLIRTLSASETELVQLRKDLSKSKTKEEEYQNLLKDEENKPKAAELYFSFSNRDAKTIESLKKQNDDMKKKVEETQKKSRKIQDEHTKLIKTMSIMRKEFEEELARLRNQLEKNLQREKEYINRLKEEEMKTKAAEEEKIEFFKRYKYV